MIISEAFAVNLGHTVIGRRLVLVREVPPLGVETGHATTAVRNHIHAHVSSDMFVLLMYDAASGNALDPRTEYIPKGLYVINIIMLLCNKIW